MTLTPQLRRAMRTVALMLLGLTLLAGCYPSLTKSVRDSIRSVSINKDINVPDDMSYSGMGVQRDLAQIFGPIGGLVGMAVDQEWKAKAQLKAAMREGQFDLAQIVREQFETALVGARIFPAIVPEGGDAEVKLEVDSFGLISGKPVLKVTGSLVRTDGTVVWRMYSSVYDTEPTPGYAWQEYVRNPQLIREVFTVAAQVVSSRLVRNMQRN